MKTYKITSAMRDWFIKADDQGVVIESQELSKLQGMSIREVTAFCLKRGWLLRSQP